MKLFACLSYPSHFTFLSILYYWLNFLIPLRCWRPNFEETFALFIINIGVQRLRVANFVTVIFLSLLVTFFVPWFWRNMYVLFQTLTNAEKLMRLKWTNAILMTLALIHRAHATVIVFLDTLGMVLSVKVRLISAMLLN